MTLSRLIAGAFSVGILLSAATVLAQNYPSKPIRIITTPAGGTADVAGRILSPAIAAGLGQQVIIDNRPQNVIPDAVAKSPPDGYTLTFVGTGFWMEPMLQKMPYSISDFPTITMVGVAPNVLVVHPSLPVKSVKELIALAKAKPGALNYNSGGVGANTHLAAELFKSIAHVNIVHIPYKGGGPAVVGLLTGDGQLMFATLSSVVTYMKSGKVRALAVTSERVTPLAPGLPTIASAGLPGYEAVTMTGIFAPSKTPGAIITRVNLEFVKALNQSDIKEKFFNVGLEASGSTPEEFSSKINAEMTRLGKVIKEGGIAAH